MSKIDKDKLKSDIARINFFTKQAKMQVWKDNMSGKNEDDVLRTIEAIGFVLDRDFVRQHPIAHRYVLDFAFIPEQVGIEIDGSNHLGKKAKMKDRTRDRYLRSANWITIRINDKDFFGYKASFYKSLIKDVVEQRREQWEKGILYPIEFINFNEEDYDFK